MFTKDCAKFTCFESLSDPRRPFANLRHQLLDIIVLALCATIANCEAWEDIEDFGNQRIKWLRKYVPLKHGIPSHDTIGRVISRLDTPAFYACLQNWIDSIQLDLTGKGIHVDGKTARHSFDTASNQAAMHMVSAWVDELSLCLGQLATEEKSNEITAVPMLLELINIKGGVVTLDAMNCQQKTVEKIIDQAADYVITVKDNQPGLAAAIADRFEDYFENGQQDRSVRSHRRKSRSRGRLTDQTVTVAAVPKQIREMGKWKGIRAIGMVYRHREAVDAGSPRAIPESDNVTYFISSLPPVASRISKYTGRHWTVENSLNWTLDVTFTEDKSRIRKGSAPAIMGGLRRFVLSLLKRDTSQPKTSMRRKRLRAALNTDILEAILAAI
jgi:predicted transposase YbfD/YdcC